MDDIIFSVMTAGEATRLWGLSRNAVSQACRSGALKGRQSEKTWLVTVYDMLVYQRGRYYPLDVPEEMKPAFARAIERMKMDGML